MYLIGENRHDIGGKTDMIFGKNRHDIGENRHNIGEKNRHDIGENRHDIWEKGVFLFSNWEWTQKGRKSPKYFYLNICICLFLLFSF